MTRRAYYTDPLAAMWMTKHFGVQVTRTHCHRGDGKFGESIQPVPIWILARDVERQVSGNVRYYVHPDSLCLLEPKQWDIGQRLQGVPVVICTQDEYQEFRAHNIGGNYVPFGDPLMDNYFRIIQRNGLAFHWPLWEEA